MARRHPSPEGILKQPTRITAKTGLRIFSYTKIEHPTKLITKHLKQRMFISSGYKSGSADRSISLSDCPKTMRPTYSIFTISISIQNIYFTSSIPNYIDMFIIIITLFFPSRTFPPQQLVSCEKLYLRGLLKSEGNPHID